MNEAMRHEQQPDEPVHGRSDRSTVDGWPKTDHAKRVRPLLILWLGLGIHR